VPDCASVGETPETSISYQREPSRVPVDEPVPEASTAMLWAVQIPSPRRSAEPSRSSTASSSPAAPPVFPRCGTVSGSQVESTASTRFAEIPVGGQTPSPE
jgi:hypothetical protein